jgi:hypothetical protein
MYMREKPIIWYLYATAGVLVVTALAKLWSVTGTAIALTKTDPITMLSYRELMLGVGVIELLTATYLLWGRSLIKRSAAALWIASNFMMYRFAAYHMNVSVCPCFGTLTDALPFKNADVAAASNWIVAVMFFGACWSLLHLNATNPRIATKRHERRVEGPDSVAAQG